MSVLSSPRSPHRFIAGRRRLRTSRRGAASAIAVTFIILILVGGLANYLANTLPTQERAAEFQHVLQVENELKQLQADILAEAAHPQTPMSLAAPLVLGSPSLPPYGAPADSVLGLDPTGSMSSQFGFSIAKVSQPYLDWGYGSCGPHNTTISNSPNCAGNSNTYTYNYTGNDTNSVMGKNSTFTITGGGTSGNNFLLNATGNQDTLVVDVSGNQKGVIIVEVRGSNDFVDFSASGSSASFLTAYVLIYGQNDRYNLTVSGFGSHNSRSGANITTEFFGTAAGTDECPNSDSSVSDGTGTIVGTPTNVNQTVIFWNNGGRFTGPTPQPYPGTASLTNANESSTNSYLIWQNESGFAPCAFTTLTPSSFNQDALGGLFLNIANRFYPQATFDFEQGAVILGGLSGTNSTMVSPFPFTTALTPEGWTANLTLVQFVVNHFDQVNGAGSVAIQTQLVKESTFQLYDGLSGNTVLLTPQLLNISTPFPQAWVGFFQQYPQVVHGMRYYDCANTTSDLANQTICGGHWGVDTYMVVAPLYVVGLTLRVITVSLTLEG